MNGNQIFHPRKQRTTMYVQQPSWRLRRGKKDREKEGEKERVRAREREKEREHAVYIFVARSLRRRDLPRFNVTSNKNVV